MYLGLMKGSVAGGVEGSVGSTETCLEARFSFCSGLVVGVLSCGSGLIVGVLSMADRGLKDAGEPVTVA